MLSKAAQYAIRACLFLATQSDDDKRFTVKQISEELDLPSPFLAKLLQKLSKANLVSSLKGSKGGFYFSTSNKQNNLWDVIICIDENQKFQSCIIGFPECGLDNPCPFHDLVFDFRNKMIGEFQDRSFFDGTGM